jgi:hypothetical protein
MIYGYPWISIDGSNPIMSKKRRHSPEEDSPSRFEGPDQHGWSPDVDKTEQQDNPSAHRSFHPDTYAPESKKRRGGASAEDKGKSTEGTPVESRGRSGEKRARKAEDEGMHDTGPKGRTQRPSGTRDASSFTGVDPKDPPPDRPSR